MVTSPELAGGRCRCAEFPKARSWLKQTIHKAVVSYRSGKSPKPKRRKVDVDLSQTEGDDEICPSNAHSTLSAKLSSAEEDVHSLLSTTPWLARPDFAVPACRPNTRRTCAPRRMPLIPRPREWCYRTPVSRPSRMRSTRARRTLQRVPGLSSNFATQLISKILTRIRDYWERDKERAVSYTHLTLPTICSV